MALSPKKFREIVVQMLYALELGGGEEGLTPLLMEEVKVTRKHASLAYSKALSLWERRTEIDQEIRLLSKSFELERIGKMEKGILRFSIAALAEESRSIVIAEAIRLTQKFASKEASGFIHAVLDAIPKESAPDVSVCA